MKPASLASSVIGFVPARLPRAGEQTPLEHTRSPQPGESRAGVEPCPQPLRVVIAEEAAVLRAGLHSMLANAGVRVVGEAETPTEAVGQAAALSPDVILLGSSLVVAEDYWVLRTMSAWPQPPAAIVLRLHADDVEPLRALACGASAYLCQVSRRSLLAAIRAAAQGFVLLDPCAVASARDALAKRTGSGPSELVHSLTAREKEVLALVAKGLSNREIAERLTLSPGTVRTHVANILSKLGVADRLQAALWAIHNGLGSA